MSEASAPVTPAAPAAPTPAPAAAPAPAQSEFNTVQWPSEPAAAPAATPEATAPEAPAAPPAAPEPFSFVTLENGERELRLETGEVYKGKTEADVLAAVARGKLEANRYIQTLKQQQAPPPPQETPQNGVDPAALAILDLIAPALGLKSGDEVKQRLTDQQQVIEAQRNHQTAVSFFREVPDFPATPANNDKLGGFLDERGMPFTVENAKLAHYYLKSTGQYEAVPEPQPRMPNGQFASANSPNLPPRANNMPMPPQGSSAVPSAAVTEADVFAMSPEEFRAYRAKFA